MPTTTQVNKLKINILTKKQYEQIPTPSDTEVYLITNQYDTIPPQKGNINKYLATDGTSLFWGNPLDTDENRLHALKGYLDNGKLLTDKEGLENVRGYAHSNFDKSKFNVVGAPKITDDGIASEFNSNNYIDTAYKPDYSKSFSIFCRFSTAGASPTSGRIIGFNGKDDYYNILCLRTSSNDYGLQFVLNNIEYRNNDIRFNYNQYYDLWLSYNKDTSSYTLQYKKAEEQNYILWSTFTSSDILPHDNSLVLGYVKSQLYNGSIDLKQFSIIVEGKTVFTSNKTDIDVIKPADYTVVGTPTITDDGIASNFSVSSYITKAFNLDTNYSTLEIDFGEIEIQAIPSGNVTEFIFYVVERTQGNLYKGITLGIYKGGCTRLTLGLSTIVEERFGNLTYSVGQKVRFKLIFDGTKYILYSKVYDGEWVQDCDEIVSNEKISFNSNIRIGGDGSIYDHSVFQGSVDLNEIKIITDKNIIYQPCLLIPYAESSTGSKIVDSYYRDRVVEVYNRYGVADYYTLSDADFTLPMGEIYGLISKASCDYSKPDYAKAVSKEYDADTEYIMKEDGWIWVQCEQFSNGASIYCYVNDTATWRFQVSSTVAAAASGGIFPLSKGDTFKYTYTAYQGSYPSVVSFNFIPIKKEYKNVL